MPNSQKDKTAPDDLKARITDRLKAVVDPETGMDVITMNMILDLEVTEDGRVSAKFRPTSPVCPIAVNLAINIKKAIQEVPGVSHVDLTVIDYVGQKMLNEQLKLI